MSKEWNEAGDREGRDITSCVVETKLYLKL
jgi:hypothetical protein